MIDSAERIFIKEHAYIPEHLPDYVTAISSTEPYLIDNFLVHVRESNLIFVGYPLCIEGDEIKMMVALDRAQTRFTPNVTSIISPFIPPAIADCTPSQSDNYFRLNLANLKIPKKTSNMLRRAQRGVSVQTGEFSREHGNLIKAFLQISKLDRDTRFVFKRVPEYCKSETALIYEARNSKGDLVAFDVADFGSKAYAFYMFNFRSRKFKVPGVSDLLLAHIIEHTQQQGKPYLNLGLGINEGVSFFKTKWGGKPFLTYTSCEQKSGKQVQWWETLTQL